MDKCYVMLADGFEELEALAPVDVLRRAGLSVTTMSITDRTAVTGAHGVTVTAECPFDAALLADAWWIICPGGMPGAANLAANEAFTEVLRKHAAAGRPLAAICASPALVFAPLGLLDGKRATCYPTMEYREAPVEWTDEGVVALPGIVTGRGPALAIPFALAIVAQALGTDAAQNVADGLLYR